MDVFIDTYVTFGRVVYSWFMSMAAAFPGSLRPAQRLKPGSTPRGESSTTSMLQFLLNLLY